MKKSILTLVSLLVLGTSAVFAQSETSKDKKADKPVTPPTEKAEKPACPPDFKGPHNMPFPPQGMPGCCDKKNHDKKECGKECDKKGCKEQNGACGQQHGGFQFGGPQGMPGMGQRPGFGQRAGMGKGHRAGHHRNMAPAVKSTPKCKCATCVELRKFEDLAKKIEDLRKEEMKLKHDLDSLHMGPQPAKK